MGLSNTQIQYYDHNFLRLPQDKRVLYNAQVDRLIKKLIEKLHENTDFKVSRVIKAGSFAKHTILRKAPGRDIDVDVAFYLKNRDITKETYESLSSEIYELLISLYPTKEVSDFEIQKKAATVRFVGTGLYVDVVPIIETAPNSDDGYQFSTDGRKTLTCVPCQLQFLKDRKDTDSHFRTLIRLGKQWKHEHDLPGLKGYSIELLMAYLLDNRGAIGTIEDRFRAFLLYICQSGLKDVISFPENSKPLGTFTDPVVILDPSNSDNNVGGRITENERQIIVSQAEDSYETASYANAGNDLEIWKEVFGSRFCVEEKQ